MARCCITGKGPYVANNVSHAHNKSKKRQLPNIQKKKVWVDDEQRWVTLTLSCRAIRSITRVGLKPYARKHGLNLKKLLGR